MISLYLNTCADAAIGDKRISGFDDFHFVRAPLFREALAPPGGEDGEIGIGGSHLLNKWWYAVRSPIHALPPAARR
jgi:hypothetical protein